MNETSPSPQSGRPRPGDTVRVVRTTTTTEVYEGVWVEADSSASGDHALACFDGTWRRVRDNGPVEFPDGDEGTYVESDAIEVISRA